MSTIVERINIYAKHKKTTKAAIERESGLPNGTFKPTTQSLRIDAQSKIAKSFPDLNIGWLLTGEGSMLKTTDQPVSQREEDATLSETDLNNSNTMNMKKYLDQVLRQNEELIRQNGVLLDLFREERAKNKGEVALKKEG